MHLFINTFVFDFGFVNEPVLASNLWQDAFKVILALQIPDTIFTSSIFNLSLTPITDITAAVLSSRPLSPMGNGIV